MEYYSAIIRSDAHNNADKFEKQVKDHGQESTYSMIPFKWHSETSKTTVT